MECVWCWSVVVSVLLCAARAQDLSDLDNEVSGEGDEGECEGMEEGDGVVCRTHHECESLGQFCCGPEGRRTCTKLSPKTKPDKEHAPLFGLIPRRCPRDPLPEPLPIRNCTEDLECWPRLCCPDGDRYFCRTGAVLWDRMPALRLFQPLRNMMAYLQCTPPPPPLYDLFPKECRSTLDCFPNLCCQEQDRRVCRPPKKSVLALLAMLGQRQRLERFG